MVFSKVSGMVWLYTEFANSLPKLQELALGYKETKYYHKHCACLAPHPVKMPICISNQKSILLIIWGIRFFGDNLVLNLMFLAFTLSKRWLINAVKAEYPASNGLSIWTLNKDTICKQKSWINICNTIHAYVSKDFELKHGNFWYFTCKLAPP